jgi:hypothetical protein
MSTWAFTALFCASAPVFLMPTIIALSVGRQYASAVTLLNLVLWTLVYLDVGSVLRFVGTIHFPLRLGAAGALLGWLILLRFVISGDTARSTA